MKTAVYESNDRLKVLQMRRNGRKTVSHGSYRAKRKPNSPHVTRRGKA